MDLKVHLVGIPKYRKAVLSGEVALRLRDLLRQITAEQELEIVSGKVGGDPVHLSVPYRPDQRVSQIAEWLKRISPRRNTRNAGTDTPALVTVARKNSVAIFAKAAGTPELAGAGLQPPCQS